MSFRDDKDALAAQVDALTREAEEARAARDAVTVERDRLATENGTLARENERLGKELERLQAAAPTRKERKASELPAKKAVQRPRRQGMVFGGVVAAFLLLFLVTFLAARKKSSKPVVENGKWMADTSNLVVPAPTEAERAKQVREEEIAFSQLNTLFHSVDLRLRLVLAGGSENPGELKGWLRAATKNRSTGVKALDGARDRYLAAVEALLPSVIEADRRRRAGLPKPVDDGSLEAGFHETSRHLRRQLDPISEGFAERQNRLDRRALSFVALVLDESSPIEQLDTAFAVLLAAFEAERFPREDTPEVVSLSRAILASIKRRGRSGISPEVIGDLTALAKILDGHHAGSLRFDP
jgi:hypothetical protein